MNLTNYIVFHDKDSLEWFIEHNPNTYKNFEYILVSNWSQGEKVMYDIDRGLSFYVAKSYKKNIEQFPSLLTFTAWYLIANNDICKTDYVGIFEYDVVFKDYIHTVEDVNKDTIYGFLPRKLPDPMYLKCIPEITKFLPKIEIQKAENNPYWNTTSNFIMHKSFLKSFVTWYMILIEKYNILSMNKHSHFHERLINYFASYTDENNATIDLIEHKQLCSHGVQL